MNLDFDPQKDYYDILGISEDADESAIKKAYRKMAMKYHPDRNKGDAAAEEKFKEVNEANEVVSDPQKRQMYDAYRKNGWAWFGDFWWFGGGWFGWWGFQVGGMDIGDLMWWFFWWWWASRGGPRQWEDLLLQLTILFEEGFHGVEKNISYKRYQEVKDLEKKTCDQCNWSWVVAQQVRTPFGVMQSQAACNVCEWAGQELYKDGRKVANGWLEEVTEKLNVKIPVAIKTWSKIRYSWMWHDGYLWWPAGDLYIKIVVRGHDTWTRSGDDLMVQADVSLFDAVLGGKIQVDHPDGKLEVKVPKWLQIWENIHISGKWFGEKWLLKHRWEMIVVPHIKIPKKLKKDEEKLRKELQSL